MKVDLDGKVVVVTGAASGVGRAVAEVAAGAGAGALFLIDRDAAGLAAAATAIDGPALAQHVADLGESGTATAAVAAALTRFGRIDALVNAAALTDRASFQSASEAEWDRLFAVNARAPFFLMQGAIADMTRRGAPGAIVNILSINAHCGAPDLAVYSATKGALMTLTRNAAHAHLKGGIRVNGINLGWTKTPAEDRMQADTLGGGPGWAARAAAAMPLGRLIEPAEVARQTVWLLSDASAPMTGVAVDLDQHVLGAPEWAA
ncbi:MAG: SDR family oxidoreductase [Acuticoccus sp.]